MYVGTGQCIFINVFLFLAILAKESLKQQMLGYAKATRDQNNSDGSLPLLKQRQRHHWHYTGWSSG